MEMEEVMLKALLVDSSTNAPVVLLQGSSEDSTDRVLPIWIGQNEALAISLELQGEDIGRPLTHDLLKSVLIELNQRLKRVVIDDLRDNTYYASLIIADEDGGEEIEIDSRPSDSIALALRTGSPIYVKEDIFQSSAIESPFEEEESEEEFEQFLEENIDLKKFKDFTEGEEGGEE